MSARLRTPPVQAAGAVGAVAFVVSLAFAWSIHDLEGPWRFPHEVQLVRLSGWLAFGFVAASLSVTPLARIAARFGRETRAARAAALRRALGVSGAILGAIHLGFAVSQIAPSSLTDLWALPVARSGLSALGILWLLALTSFGPAIRALRVRLWKGLHRLAYVAAALVLHHLLLSPFANLSLVVGLFLALCVLGSFRLLGPRRVATGEDLR